MCSGFGVDIISIVVGVVVTFVFRCDIGCCGMADGRWEGSRVDHNGKCVGRLECELCEHGDVIAMKEEGEKFQKRRSDLLLSTFNPTTGKTNGQNYFNKVIPTESKAIGIEFIWEGLLEELWAGDRVALGGAAFRKLLHDETRWLELKVSWSPFDGKWCAAGKEKIWLLAICRYCCGNKSIWRRKGEGRRRLAFCKQHKMILLGRWWCTSHH